MMFYVYELIDPVTNLPFYVGKGKKKRASYHYNCAKRGGKFANKRLENFLLEMIDKELKPNINYVAYFNNESEAYDCETMLIEKYGRKNIENNGILLNWSKGGEGCTRPDGSYAGNSNPFYGKKHSDESKALISKNNARVGGFRGKRHSEETKKHISESKKGTESWIKGKKHSEETKIKMSDSAKKRNRQGMTDKTHSEETKKRISEKLTGRSLVEKLGSIEKAEAYKLKMSQIKKEYYERKKNARP